MKIGNYLMILLSAQAMFLTGCAQLQAPKYSFSPEDVQSLKETGGGKIRVGEFKAATAETETQNLSLRAAHMQSPYGSYANYLKEALQDEIREAGRLADDASIELTGVLVKHVFDASGMSTGVGELQAQIVVSRGGNKVYDKLQSAKISWESSFVGAVAIPKAVTEYPRLMREFVHTLVLDPEFRSAIK